MRRKREEGQIVVHIGDVGARGPQKIGRQEKLQFDMR